MGKIELESVVYVPERKIKLKVVSYRIVDLSSIRAIAVIQFL